MFRRKRKQADFKAEIEAHLEIEAERLKGQGLSEKDARREARRAFGNVTQAEERFYESGRWLLWDRLAQNLRFGLRQLRHSPGFTVVAVATLALGIGANSAVFSALDAVVLRPLAFPDSDQLMKLNQYNPRTPGQSGFLAPVRLEDWNRMNSTFQAISGYYTQDESETSGTLPEKVTLAAVAPRFLQVWGVAPVLGRDFNSEEERFGGPAAVLISDRFWRRRFGADPGAVGKKLHLGGYSYTVIGVMPASFLFPDRDVDLWSPVPMNAPYAQSRESTWFVTIGRLKPGVTVAQSKANLATVQAQLGKQYPKTDAHLSVGVQPLKDTIVDGVRGSVWILFGSVSLLLLIACTNIAALLLARASQRQHEIAIRFSLGAARATVVAQLLTEAFILALGGAAAGLAVAGGASKVFRSLAGNLPRLDEIRLDWRIVLYCLACALAATFLCGLLPAIRTTRRGLSGSLAQASRTQVSERSPLQWLLVGVQIALAVTMLAGAGLLLRSFQALGRVSPGFDPDHVLTLHITGGYGETADMKGLTQRIDRTLDFLRNVPGVEGAATSATLPGVPAQYQIELKLAEGGAEADRKIMVESRFVSPGYFTTMRIPLLAGEPCRQTSDGTTVVVNRSFANAYLPGSSAIGHHLLGSEHSFVGPGEIRGIVGDAREEGINHEPVPTVYWCVSAPNPDPYYLIRTRAEPMAMAEVLRRKIHEIEPARSVFDIMPLGEHLSDAFADARLRTVLLAFFAISAVLLASVGLYGTLSYFVGMRRREVGLRLALGALPRQILRQFLLKGLGISVLGCAAGLVLAGASRRLLAGMLYGVSPSDATTLLGVALIVVALAAVASLLPAIRAARVEPMRVLRDE